MCKQDNPEAYKETLELSDADKAHIHQLWELDCADEILAKIFFARYGDLFMYDSTRNKHGEWYEINEFGIWDTAYQYVAMDKKMSELAVNLEKELRKYFDEITGDNDKMTPAQKGRLHKKLISIVKKLNTQKTHQDIHASLKKFYNFVPKFDATPHLMGFKNGVYDASTFTFRKADRNEMVHMTTNYNFELLNDDDEEMERAEKLLESIHGPNLDFMLTCAAMGIGGVNNAEIVLFHVGPGSNGKSLYADILDATFGALSYAGVPASFFIEEQNNTKSKPDPFLLEFEGKRFVCSGEGKKKAMLDSALIKSLSGNDVQRGRNLNEKKIESFRMMCIMNMFTNYFPQIDGDDGGIRRRTIIVKYHYNFVDNVVKPTDRQIDRNIKTTLGDEKFKNAVFNVLLRYYKKFVSNGKKVIVPDKIRQDTEEYLNSIAPIYLFFNNEIKVVEEKTLKSNEREKIDKWYEIYKAKDKDSAISKNSFRLELEKKDLKFVNVGGYFKCANGILLTDEEKELRDVKNEEDN
jgi:P4 family phage/plasmid primase-like protien